ncbi:MAG: class I SAM-dependent methyltransferase, partial [Solirubrobacterales bacterium]|nr:class I SAM-dependent methyltransferase [Solirubrobacterales bacterium]
MDESFRLNRASWDERAPAHAASPGYAVDRFRDDPSFISDVVRFDVPRLGDVTGLTGVHLQCHIGTDTISLARLGARMTGLDFSPASLEQGRRLAESAGPMVEFVECEVYDAPDVLGAGRFDFVFTGIGAICWLPSIRRWAEVVAQLLAPGGWLFMREGHPMMWTLAEREDGMLVVEHPYFERDEPNV